MLVKLRNARAIALVLAKRSRCLETFELQFCGVASPMSVNDSPFLETTVALQMAKFPFSAVGKLDHIDLDLRNALLMPKIQQPLIFDEIMPVDADDEAWVQLRLFPVHEMGTLDLAIGNAVHDRENVFAPKVGIPL